MHMRDRNTCQDQSEISSKVNRKRLKHVTWAFKNANIKACKCVMDEVTVNVIALNGSVSDPIQAME